MSANHRSRPEASVSTLVELLRWRALQEPDRPAISFLADGEVEGERATYGELDRQARAIAARLQSWRAEGERALLIYPQGIEHIAAFFGCLYAGVIAIPLYPPRLNDRHLSRVRVIAADAQATIGLTSAPILAKMGPAVAEVPELERMRWLATDTLAGEEAESWREPSVSQATLAFLQYTSGSTGVPRGVMVSQGNLMSNLSSISQTCGLSPASVEVSWAPMFHDMGLIMGILLPLYGGFPLFLMSPATFLRRPFRWLQAISRYRGTFSFGPNFAFDLCARKVTPEQRAVLDLSRWTMVINGAEPVHPITLDDFVAAFGPCGFRREAFYPGYGLAEATLVVSCGRPDGPPAIEEFQKSVLERGRAVRASIEMQPVRRLAGCGQPMPEQRVVIVDPESLTPCQRDQIGEIWVSGPSIAHGYWNRPDETDQTFRAHLSDTGAGPFLRTGDLGFLHARELFITGRIKDLIIIRGNNHYPQDIELTGERSHPALRAGGAAAFAVEDETEERVVVVQEVEYLQQPDVEAVVGAIREAVADEHGIAIHDVILIRPGSMSRTSSGKVQRRACRAAYLAGALSLWRAPEEQVVMR